MSYTEFLKTKQLKVQPLGVVVSPADVHSSLFDFQRDLVVWAARKGRAALFADTGLGKTRQQLEWARLMGGRSLVVAPLGVARQTVAEAAQIGIDAHYTRDGGDLVDGINITNYEMIGHFNPADFNSVVLDESSILKALDGKTRGRLIEMFGDTPYRLCCTATPAPNDITEIANHAEFLGVMTRAEMLAMFFVHDDAGWRLKGHAEQAFYRWLASWAMSIRRPSDLGYSDAGYILPPLTIEPLWVASEFVPQDTLFFMGLKGIQDRNRVRHETLGARVAATADLVNGDGDQWIVWCGLNDEGQSLAKLVPGAVLMEGSQSPDEKAAALDGFIAGKHRVLITKPKIAGFGLNLQNAHKMAFLGLSDSFEAYYQCVRRCYRFGQTQPVDAYIVLSDMEEEIYANVMAKEKEAARMSEQLVEHVRQFEQEEIRAVDSEEWEYQTGETAGRDYRLMLGDSAERMAEIAADSVHLSVFSPPFQSLYTYSPTERDLGNCRTSEEFYGHFNFIIDELLRVTVPGRNACVHVAQVPAMLARDGYIGIKDFRGDVIRAFEARGWVYHGEVCIDKDPQAQAIRTKSKALLFMQMHKDASWSRPALADYILIFRKPGDNPVPVQPDLTNVEWVEFARPIWYGIRESDTLQFQSAREDNDERHICPLQLGTIERCVRLWSNKGETVLDPFTGIGSTGHVAIKNGRRFVGCELKPSYFNLARRNLDRAETTKYQPTLFDLMPVEIPA